MSALISYIYIYISIYSITFPNKVWTNFPNKDICTFYNHFNNQLKEKYIPNFDFRFWIFSYTTFFSYFILSNFSTYYWIIFAKSFRTVFTQKIFNTHIQRNFIIWYSGMCHQNQSNSYRYNCRLLIVPSRYCD